MTMRIFGPTVAVLLAGALGLPAQIQLSVPSSHPTLGPALGVRAYVDIDADGDLDILTTNGVDALHVLRNDGTALAFMFAIAVGAQPRSVAVGDVDGDGDQDIVTAGETPPTVSLLLNNQNLNLFRIDIPTGSYFGPAELVDADADGDLDVVLGNRAALVNTGGGALSAPVGFGVPGGGRRVRGDLDGDGLFDLVVGGGVSGPPVAWLRSSGLSFTPVTLNSGVVPNDVFTLGDVDADGDLDFVYGREVTSFSGAPTIVSRVVRTLVNDGLGGLTPGAQIVFAETDINLDASDPVAVRVEDLDGDGHPDVLLSTVTPVVSAIQIAVAQGSDAGFLAQSFLLVYGGIGVPDSGDWIDLDGDGDVDFIRRDGGGVQAPFAAQLSVYRNETPTPLYQLLRLSGDGQAIGTGAPYPQPLVVRAVDATGAPVAGVPVTFAGNVVPASATVVTGAGGTASFAPLAGASGGSLIVSATAHHATPTQFPLFVRRLDATWAPSTSALTVTHHHESGGVPILIGVDTPLPPPGFVPSPFGSIYTSLVAPGPSFFALDGIGLFTAPSPLAVTPFSQTQVLVGFAGSGLTVVLQVYGYDASFGFPAGAFITNHQVVTF